MRWRNVMFMSIGVFILFTCGAIAGESVAGVSSHEQDQKIAQRKAAEDENAVEKRMRKDAVGEMMEKAKKRFSKADTERREQMKAARRKRKRAAHSRHSLLGFNFRFPLDSLTAEQRQKIERIHLQLEQERIRKEAEIRVKEIDIRIEMLKLTSDRGAIEALVKEMGDLRTQIKLTEVGAMFDALGVLTPDQRKVVRQQMMRK